MSASASSEDPAEVSPHRFRVHTADLSGTQIAYVHEGVGGVPLLLVHGWPETKRIWWRNISPLAEAGFEVIAPDLRGFGDSSAAADGHYDVAASSADLHALVTDHLGHDTCVAAGGDFGGLVLQDLSLRHPGFVMRQTLFNTMPPFLDDYERAGIKPIQFTELEHFVRHGQHADILARELDSADRRRNYVATFYNEETWAGPGAFSDEARSFMTDPFADEETFRTSLELYEYGFGREPSAPPLLFQANTTETLVLYGPEDDVVPLRFVDCMSLAFTNVVGPFGVFGAGHFLQWERAATLNGALEWFCRDLLGDAVSDGSACKLR